MPEFEVSSQRLETPVFGYSELKTVAVWGRQFPYLLHGNENDPLYQGPIYLGQEVMLGRGAPTLLRGHLAYVLGLRNATDSEHPIQIYNPDYSDCIKEPMWIGVCQAIDTEYSDPTISGEPRIGTFGIDQYGFDFEALYLPAFRRVGTTLKEIAHCLAVRLRLNDKTRIITVGGRGVATRTIGKEWGGIIEKLEVQKGFGLRGITAWIEGRGEEIYYVT